MLPNKMKISEGATNSLRRVQSNTGLTSNIGARLAFFLSIERGFRVDLSADNVDHNGRELDKHTWLGEHGTIIEQLLEMTYPGNTKQQHYDAWASHVDDGAKEVEAKSTIDSFFS